MSGKKYRLKYPGSKGWLIFWMIVCFPIGLVLATRTNFISGDSVSYWEYDGDRFWLYFWAVFFFPIVILLLIFKGALQVR